MRWVAIGAGVLLGVPLVYGAAHLALIEVGREVVVLRKWTSEGRARPTRLWIVEEGETAWLHHGSAQSPWIRRLEQEPEVAVERDGTVRRYRATPDPASHERVHGLLREKYGIADRWVRFVTGTREDCPALPVRLEPLSTRNTGNVRDERAVESPQWP